MKISNIKIVKDNITTIKQIRNNVKSGDIILTNSEKIGLTYYEDLNKLMDRKTSLSLYKYIVKKIANSNILQREKGTISIAGSYPSGKLMSKDLDILIFTDKYDLPASKTIPKKILTDISSLFTLDELKIYQIGNTKLLGIIIYKNIARHVDIRLLPSKSKVAGELYFTSGRDFNIMIRHYASSRGYLLNEYGLFNRKTNKFIKLDNEEELFDKIGLSYIPLYDRRIDIFNNNNYFFFLINN